MKLNENEQKIVGELNKPETQKILMYAVGGAIAIFILIQLIVLIIIAGIVYAIYRVNQEKKREEKLNE